MSEKTPNRLANSASPYLRSAAHQPVDWHEWGEEAFARARAEDKPILLDIGAVWCHWCHVIDRESYDDPELAALINRLFIPVKVDRDERPDVDARYQTAVSAMSGAGWLAAHRISAAGRAAVLRRHVLSAARMPWAAPASAACSKALRRPIARGARKWSRPRARCTAQWRKRSFSQAARGAWDARLVDGADRFHPAAI